MTNKNMEDISVYKKKKASNVSKSKKKSNHKHDYKECLIEYPLKIYFNINNRGEQTGICNARYCSICGKLNGSKYHDTIKEWNSSFNRYVCRGLTKEERKEKYKALPYFKLETPFQEYVSINNCE